MQHADLCFQASRVLPSDLLSSILNNASQQTLAFLCYPKSYLNKLIHLLQCPEFIKIGHIRSSFRKLLLKLFIKPDHGIMGYGAVTYVANRITQKGTCTGLWGASKFKVLWYRNPWEVLLYPHLFWVGRGPKPNILFHPKENLQGFEMCTVTACKFKHPVARCTDFYFLVSYHSLFLLK